MKRLINLNSIFCFMLLAIFGLASCDEAPSTSDPITTDNYPTANFTTDFEGNTIAEGDTIMYQVTTDKPLENAVTLELSVSGDNVEESDYQYEPVTIPAYSSEDTVNVPIIFTMDNIPEESEELTFRIEDQDMGTKYSLNPDTDFPEKTVTVENVNDPSGLTVAFGWENSEDDMDMLVNLDDGSGSGLQSYAAAASADNPETLVLGNDTAGDFYFSIDPFEYNQSTINYEFRVGYPDQSVEFFEGSFNADDPAESITMDPFAAYELEEVPRLLEVNVSGSGEYSVDHVN